MPENRNKENIAVIWIWCDLNSIPSIAVGIVQCGIENSNTKFTWWWQRRRRWTTSHFVHIVIVITTTHKQTRKNSVIHVSKWSAENLKLWMLCFLFVTNSQTLPSVHTQTSLIYTTYTRVLPAQLIHVLGVLSDRHICTYSDHLHFDILNYRICLLPKYFTKLNSFAIWIGSQEHFLSSVLSTLHLLRLRICYCISQWIGSESHLGWSKAETKHPK